ncbi:MAG: hypothetical protein AAF222_04595 [Pseudomonadota bacterium]
MTKLELAMTILKLTTSVCALAVSAGLAHAQTQPSFGALEFGLEDTLFVANSAAGAITAYDLPNEGTPPAEDMAFNILDLDTLVAQAIGTEGRIVYNDLAVHPVTRDAYVSLDTTIDGQPSSAVVAVTQDGGVTVIDLDTITSSTFALESTADESISFWRDIPAPTLTITDMDFVNDELFVSGISTGEFASTLRRVAYPFDGPEVSSSIEMFHAAHGQNETRAPIRAMSVVDLDGVSTVVAAYTCTPLVTIPTDDLQDGAHVLGKTIAELGYGNRPLDVIPFSTANMEGEVESYVLVVNREMDADLISMDVLTEAANAPGLSEPIPYLGATVGVETVPLPMSGVVHAADQDNQFILAMRRDLDTGAMEMVSFRKGAFFRLSDFISEYNFPDYAYTEEAQGVRMFQNMLKADEGFPDQIVQ